MTIAESKPFNNYGRHRNEISIMTSIDRGPQDSDSAEFQERKLQERRQNGIKINLFDFPNPDTRNTRTILVLYYVQEVHSRYRTLWQCDSRLCRLVVAVAMVAYYHHAADRIVDLLHLVESLGVGRYRWRLQSLYERPSTEEKEQEEEEEAYGKVEEDTAR